MRRIIALFVVTLVALFSVGCCATTPDVTDVNETWKDLFDSFRRPTAAELEEYEALDDEGKEAWAMEGRPTNDPLEQDDLDIIEQMYEANKALGKAHEGEEADEPEADEPDAPVVTEEVEEPAEETPVEEGEVTDGE